MAAAFPARSQPGKLAPQPASVPLESAEEDVTGNQTADNLVCSTGKTTRQNNFSQLDV